MYYEKLAKFFKNKELTHKRVGEIMGYSPTMIGRYLKGSDKINADFISVLIKNWPEIDLQYLFCDDNKVSGELSEPGSKYGLDENYIIGELEFIENKIASIRKYLAQKCHEEK